MESIELKAKKLQDKTIAAYKKLKGCLDEINQLLPTYKNEQIFITHQESDGFLFCWNGFNNTVATTYILENLIKLNIQQKANPQKNFDTEIHKLLIIYLI